MDTSHTGVMASTNERRLLSEMAISEPRKDAVGASLT